MPKKKNKKSKILGNTFLNQFKNAMLHFYLDAKAYVPNLKISSKHKKGKALPEDYYFFLEYLRKRYTIDLKRKSEGIVEGQNMHDYYFQKNKYLYFKDLEDFFIRRSFNYYLKFDWEFLVSPNIISRLNECLNENSFLSSMEPMLLAASGDFYKLKFEKMLARYMCSFRLPINCCTSILGFIQPFKYPILQVYPSVDGQSEAISKYIVEQKFVFEYYCTHDSAKLERSYLNSLKYYPNLYQDFVDEPLYFERDFFLEINNYTFSKVCNFNSNTLKAKPVFQGDIVTLNADEIHECTYDKSHKCWNNLIRKKTDKQIKLENNQKRMEYMDVGRFIKRIFSPSNCQWIVRFFESIPNYNLQLTEEEKAVVSSEGNVIVIGRSGTGKTTSIILRMFANEILFKVSKKIQNSKDNNFALINFVEKDMDEVSQIHLAFITASPVLTSEVSRYYSLLKEKVKLELRNREERRKKKLDNQLKEEKEEEPSSTFDLIDDYLPPLELKKQDSSQELPDLEENDFNIMDYEELSQQMNIPHSLRNLNDHHFPLFLTIRRLIFMIDAVLKHPFFVRDGSGKIEGIDSTAEWHNESRGIMLINNYYKFIQQDIESETNYETIDPSLELDKKYLSKVLNQELMNPLPKKKEVNVNKGRMKGRETNFEMFRESFLPRTYGRFQKLLNYLDPAMIWREIQSKIKGSIDAHLYCAHYMPIENYLNNKKNDLYPKKIVEDLYELFYRYERWKNENNSFDIADVVNHILSQFRWKGYNSTSIHFTMCDEIQDLPQNTIYLILKVTEHNVFFAGDTAQAIIQSVGFTFKDLKSQFNEFDKKFNEPKILHLNTNFRSHSKILDLSNSIVRLIEIIFPNTIDHLRKEKSILDGPKPIFF